MLVAMFDWSTTAGKGIFGKGVYVTESSRKHSNLFILQNFQEEKRVAKQVIL